MKNMKFLFVGLLIGFVFVPCSWAACSGEYNRGCGTNCCYKMIGTQAIIQEGSTNIGNAAFYGSQITGIEIPASVTTIGDSAFNRAYQLEKVVFAEGSNLKTINYAAFYETEKLTHITLPDGVEDIGYIAFAGSGIQEITVSDQTIIPKNSILATDWSEAPILNLSTLVFKCSGDIVQCNTNLISGGLQSGSFNLVQTSYKKKNEDGSVSYYDDNAHMIGKNIYDNQGNLLKQYVYQSDGSISVYDQFGKLIGLQGKRILTVDEVTALVSGKGNNTFKLRYR